MNPSSDAFADVWRAVPTVRDVALTGPDGLNPYFHNNSAATLEEVVDHYVEFFQLRRGRARDLRVVHQRRVRLLLRKL